MAVFEFFEMSPEAERIILDNPVESRLWEVARARGMLTMQEDAMLKAFAKQIPFSEVNELSSILVADDEEAKTHPSASPQTPEDVDAGVSTTQEIMNTNPIAL
jgi:hypothetical protein